SCSVRRAGAAGDVVPPRGARHGNDRLGLAKTRRAPAAPGSGRGPTALTLAFELRKPGRRPKRAPSRIVPGPDFGFRVEPAYPRRTAPVRRAASVTAASRAAVASAA